MFDKIISFSLEEYIGEKHFFLLIKVINIHSRKVGKYTKAQRRCHSMITTDYIFAMYPTLSKL